MSDAGTRPFLSSAFVLRVRVVVAGEVGLEGPGVGGFNVVLSWSFSAAVAWSHESYQKGENW